MIINKVKMIILFCTLALSIVSCTPGSQADEVPINRDIAIMIATANLPSSVIGDADAQTLWDESNWIVHFMLTHNKTVNKSELGWPQSPNNKFVNQGLLPANTFSLLTFTIDRMTGIVLSRQASDSVLLGGPGTFNTEPPERVFIPFWSAIAFGIGGLILGGMITWLIMRRAK